MAAYPRAWVAFTEELVRVAGNAASDLVVRALHELTENQLRESAERSDAEEANKFRAMIARSCWRLVAAIADGDIDAALKEFLRQPDAKAKGMASVLGDEATAVDVFGEFPV